MKNLKRALCLALSSIMLMGMMVVGSGAGYADVDSSDNQVAIDVLKAVGVMEGDENGNFNPDNNVTRNEMAVVMTKLLGLKAGGSSPFTDVPAWAQPYVAACYNNGVIAGISATEFGGSNNVTAAQAALMVMKTLGYFGFQGEFGQDWKLATVKQATKIDLFNNMNVYTDEALTRNDVAQLVLNALESDVVVVTEQGGLAVEGNGISVNQKPSYSVVIADDKAGHKYDTVNDGDLQLCEKLYGADLKKVIGGAPDAFGRPATTWTYKAETIKAAAAPTLTYTTAVKGKTVYADLGKPSLTGYTINYAVDGDTTVNTGAISAANTANLVGSGKGAVTEIFLDTDSKTLTTVVYKYYLGIATADYNETAETIDIDVAGNDAVLTYNNVSVEDFPIVKDLKKDDYVVITLTTTDAAATAANTTLRSIAPAKVVEGQVVTAARDCDYVLAGGTKYLYSDVTEQFTSHVGYAAMADASAYALDTKYDLYLDPNGYVLGIEGTISKFDVSKYLFVKGVASNGFDTIAKVLFSDGTSKSVTISKIDSDDSVIPSDVAADKFYGFKLDKNGNYVLTTVAASGGNVDLGQFNATNMAGVDSDSVNIYSGYYANEDTTYVAKNVAMVGLKKAPNVAAAAGTNAYFLVDDSNLVLWAYFTEKGSSASNKDLVYVVNGTPAYATKNDVDYYIYTVVINGEKTTLETTDVMAGQTMYKIDSYDADGYAEVSAAVVADHVFTAGASFVDYAAGTLVLSTGGYALTDDVMIRTINVKNGEVKTITASGIEKAMDTDSFTNVVLFKDKDNIKVTGIYLWKNT